MITEKPSVLYFQLRELLNEKKDLQCLMCSGFYIEKPLATKSLENRLYLTCYILPHQNYVDLGNKFLNKNIKINFV